VTAVLDASVAVKLFLREAGTAEAEALRAQETFIAPDLIVVEVVNAMWRHIRVGHAAPSFMTTVMAGLPTLCAQFVPTIDLAPRAAEISMVLDHPAYDCFYVALAEREGVDLITADRRLIAKTRGTAFDAVVRPLVP
jgi:predicted nucleic acid-binding protein